MHRHHCRTLTSDGPPSLQLINEDNRYDGPTIDQTFITKFNNDMHLTYRQIGSKFRGLVRTDASVKAETCRFYKLGTVRASSKSRNGEIPASNPDHAYATATMADRYCLVYVDELDLTKLAVDVRGLLRQGWRFRVRHRDRRADRRRDDGRRHHDIWRLRPRRLPTT